MKRVITYGTFDLLHYGHINLLRRAKEQGDYLIVALSTDEFNWNEKQKKCYFSYEQRKMLLEAIRYVDLVIPEENWEQKRSDVKEYHVDISDYNIDHFDSFNDFFTRKRMYGTTTRSNELMAIADSKLSVYRVDEKLKLNIKNSIYELKDIIQQKEIADLYKNGYALVFRLAVNDYHRYVFFDDGELISSEFIKGELHTIRPVSEKYKVYARNSRVVNVMDSKSFGIITQVEIGALLVGKIVNHNTHMFSRLEEKGYFEYGGSTIVMFFPPNIMIDEDILRQSQAGYETQVFIGDKIGQRKE